MVDVQFYPIDIDYDKEGGVILFGRTIDGERIIVKDNSIKPYFWVFLLRRPSSSAW